MQPWIRRVEKPQSEREDKAIQKIVCIYPEVPPNRS